MQRKIWFLIFCSLSVLGMALNTFGNHAYGASNLSEAIQMKLKDQRLISVTTQRANGEWSSKSLVWFMNEDDAVYLMTKPTSHKARRVQRGSQMQVWLENGAEPILTGPARFITDNVIIDRMDKAYRKKYWSAWLFYWARPLAGRVESGKIVVIQIQTE